MIPTEIVCDFCHRSDVVWAYPCVDFEMPEFGFGSRSAWAASTDPGSPS